MVYIGIVGWWVGVGEAGFEDVFGFGLVWFGFICGAVSRVTCVREFAT